MDGKPITSRLHYYLGIDAPLCSPADGYHNLEVTKSAIVMRNVGTMPRAVPRVKGTVPLSSWLRGLEELE